jgi:diguanylate cyclase (GGDEF)-like protein
MRVPTSIPRLRIGLLGTFAIASALPIVALGLVLAHFLGTQIHDRSLASAVRAAELTTRLGVQPHFTRAELARQLSPNDRRALDAALRPSAKGEAAVAEMQIWNARRRLVYSSAAGNIGHVAIGKPSPELIDALGGATASEVIASRGNIEKQNRALVKRFGSLLEVYVPIRLAGMSHPAGVFELYLPYAPVGAAIATDTNRMYMVLLVGLSILYAVLFRLVGGASRELRVRAEQLRTQAERAQHDAMHDPLTSLPNRTLFRDRAHQAILASGRNGHQTALLLIDLDRFKEINDTLGHQSGDLLLREIGPRIRKLLRAADTVARFGGDEFGILLPEVPGPAAAVDVARAVHRALEEPFAVQGLTLDVEASIGIALHPLHAADFEELMQHADVAMYQAKGKRSGYEVYVPSDDDSDASRLKLAGELRQAAQRGELVMHYQPKADLATGRIVGAEALMRWRHPRHGLMAPDRFIPLAERSGLIRTLTIFAARTALRQCREWLDEGHELTVSVNLSTRDLIDVHLPDEIGRLLSRTGVPASLLELEITESVIMADPMRARGVVARLREMGVKVAIDDFGSGYSSLGYLKRLPVNDLKIDKSFVINMIDDPGDNIIVQSTIDLAHNLGLSVIAEGVENEEIWRRLRALGCDVAQGWLIGRPIPAAEFGTWMRRGTFAPPTERAA